MSICGFYYSLPTRHAVVETTSVRQFLIFHLCRISNNVSFATLCDFVEVRRQHKCSLNGNTEVLDIHIVDCLT